VADNDLDVSPEVSREEIQRRVDKERADFLGRRVREVWVEWASRQPNPKPSWLAGWDDLDDGQREVDRLIGQKLAAEGQREVERSLDFQVTCVSCAHMLDECYRSDMRREAAERALSEERQRHEALLAQAEDYAREVQEENERMQAAVKDLLELAEDSVLGHRPDCMHRQRLGRARAVLRPGNDDD
jgi:hypothetical protein